MDQTIVGQWVEVELVNGKIWVGRVEEYDEEALFISNGFEFGHVQHKGAECANNEVKNISLTDNREFAVQ